MFKHALHTIMFTIISNIQNLYGTMEIKASPFWASTYISSKYSPTVPNIWNLLVQCFTTNIIPSRMTIPQGIENSNLDLPYFLHVFSTSSGHWLGHIYIHTTITITSDKHVTIHIKCKIREKVIPLIDFTGCVIAQFLNMANKLNELSEACLLSTMTVYHYFCPKHHFNTFMHFFVIKISSDDFKFYFS